MFVLLADKRGLLISVAYMGIGFSPIGALALTIGGLWPLSIGSLLMIVPSVILALVLGIISPWHRRTAVDGFLAGLVAVLIYDIVRWDFVAFHLWGDFIPNIGGWLDGTQKPNWLLGYGFRYLGDGGGMGLTFMVAARTFAPSLTRRSPLLLAIGYGIFIWVCLLLTLLASPDGQVLLFPLTPTTLLLSWIGHFVYGSVLGLFLARGEVVGRCFGRLVKINFTVQVTEAEAKLGGVNDQVPVFGDSDTDVRDWHAARPHSSSPRCLQDIVRLVDRRPEDVAAARHCRTRQCGRRLGS